MKVYLDTFFLLHMSWRMWFLHLGLCKSLQLHRAFSKPMHLPYRWTDVVVKVILNKSTHDTGFPHTCVLWLWEKQKHWNIVKYQIYDQWSNVFRCLTWLQTFNFILKTRCHVFFLQYVISEVCILYAVWNTNFGMYKIPGWHTFAITHSILHKIPYPTMHLTCPSVSSE